MNEDIGHFEALIHPNKLIKNKKYLDCTKIWTRQLKSCISVWILCLPAVEAAESAYGMDSCCVSYYRRKHAEPPGTMLLEEIKIRSLLPNHAAPYWDNPLSSQLCVHPSD